MRGPPTIRLALPKERDELVELQRRASLNNAGDRKALLAHPEAIDLPLSQIEAGQVFVGTEGERLLGFSAVLMRDDGNVELDGLFVEPEIWKGGVGRALVARAVEYSKFVGAVKLHVIGNPHAEGFYLKVGFKITGEFETQFGRGLLMEMCV